MSGEQSDTPLARLLKGEIRQHGPISVSRYMQACLTHEEFGYYRSKQAIGSAGDFITAPEISQIFGELIGLWCAAVWQQLGQPARVHLVELGPGRGTLMADALRSSGILPAFVLARRVHLVEVNGTLRDMQKEKLASWASDLTWHEAWPEDSVFGDDPVIVIGNEFLDALPADQAVFQSGRWKSRMVGLDGEGAFQFTAGGAANGDWGSDGIEGEVRLRSPAQDALIGKLAHAAGQRPLVALFIDYGADRAGTGDLLQAVRAHKYVPVFEAPGDCDLTVPVDFSAVGQSARTHGLSVDGPVPQAEFLGRLGAVERASRLMSFNPGKAGTIDSGLARLLAPGGMGSHFKVIGLRSSHVPVLPGLEEAQP